MTNSYAAVNGFNLYRADRDTASAQKESGGGVCAYVNERWCHGNNVRVTHQSCSPNLEILTLNIRSFYPPREIPLVIMNIVYIPPHANVTTANNTLTDLISDQQAKSPDAAIYITGDFKLPGAN